MSVFAQLQQSRLETLLFRDQLRFGQTLARAEQLRFQAMVSIIPARGSGEPIESHGYRADHEYFYPASTVKLAAAAVAMDRLADPDCVALRVDESSPMIYEPCYPGEGIEREDPSNAVDGTITIGHDCRHALIISDNAAHNRLFEFVGHEPLNTRLREAGLTTAAINHRLSEPHPPAEQRRTPRIRISGRRGTLVIPERDTALPLTPCCSPGTLVGREHMDGSDRVPRPMSFADRNRIGLTDLHHLIIGVARPDAGARVRFPLTEARRAMICESLRLTPRESVNPRCGDGYADDFVKPFLPGVRRAMGGAPFTLLNKLGWALRVLHGHGVHRARAERACDRVDRDRLRVRVGRGEQR